MNTQSIALGILMAVTVSTFSISMAKADDHDTLKYQAWSAKHSDWVRSHPDRAHFFVGHPEAAEKYRHEWADWHGDKTQFSEWAENHPGWVTTHKQRAEIFRSHPEQAEKSRKEWLEHRESKTEYSEWAKNHDIGDRAHDGDHDHHDHHD